MQSQNSAVRRDWGQRINVIFCLERLPRNLIDSPELLVHFIQCFLLQKLQSLRIKALVRGNCLLNWNINFYFWIWHGTSTLNRIHNCFSCQLDFFLALRAFTLWCMEHLVRVFNCAFMLINAQPEPLGRSWWKRKLALVYRLNVCLAWLLLCLLFPYAVWSAVLSVGMAAAQHNVSLDCSLLTSRGVWVLLYVYVVFDAGNVWTH